MNNEQQIEVRRFLFERFFPIEGDEPSYRVIDRGTPQRAIVGIVSLHDEQTPSVRLSPSIRLLQTSIFSAMTAGEQTRTADDFIVPLDSNQLHIKSPFAERVDRYLNEIIKAAQGFVEIYNSLPQKSFYEMNVTLRVDIPDSHYITESKFRSNWRRHIKGDIRLQNAEVSSDGDHVTASLSLVSTQCGPEERRVMYLFLTEVALSLDNGIGDDKFDAIDAVLSSILYGGRGKETSADGLTCSYSVVSKRGRA